MLAVSATVVPSSIRQQHAGCRRWPGGGRHPRIGPEGQLLWKMLEGSGQVADRHPKWRSPLPDEMWRVF